MRYRISHVTRYTYGDPVSLCHSVTHLKPCETAFQRCVSSQVRVMPWPSVSREHVDIFGNRVNYFSIQQAHSELEVTAVSEVDVGDQIVPPEADTPPWEEVRDGLREARDADTVAARIFALPSPAIPSAQAAWEYAQASFLPGRPILEAAHDLMSRIFSEFEYDPAFTTVATPLTTALEHRRGVCQDFAHVGIACLRSLGLPARYVSGYLETLPPPGQPKLRGADASHAWFSVFVPGLTQAGVWVDFDPTNDCLIHQQHITTAIGRDYQDVTPVRGVFYGGGEHQLMVAVDVDRLQQV
ncbi:MAG: transglutaminase family protein [Thiohalocapsa sp.]